MMSYRLKIESAEFALYIVQYKVLVKSKSKDRENKLFNIPRLFEYHKLILYQSQSRHRVPKFSFALKSFEPGRFHGEFEFEFQILVHLYRNEYVRTYVHSKVRSQITTTYQNLFALDPWSLVRVEFIFAFDFGRSIQHRFYVILLNCGNWTYHVYRSKYVDVE